MRESLQESKIIKLTLPDGSIREFPMAVSGLEIAMAIGPGLANAALAIRFNGELRDLKSQIYEDGEFSVVTLKDEDALELIRHDTAHVLAQAVQELYPDTQVTIGPTIENGFYYDFAREKQFSSDDFEVIENRMVEIIDQDLPIERKVWNRDEAANHFLSKGSSFIYERWLCKAMKIFD